MSLLLLLLGVGFTVFFVGLGLVGFFNGGLLRVGFFLIRFGVDAESQKGRQSQGFL